MMECILAFTTLFFAFGFMVYYCLYKCASERLTKFEKKEEEKQPPKPDVDIEMLNQVCDRNDILTYRYLYCDTGYIVEQDGNIYNTGFTKQTILSVAAKNKLYPFIANKDFIILTRQNNNF